jgi:hypothetical protein
MKQCIYYYENRSMHMLGYDVHLFRKDAVPHSVLVIAIISAVVLLIPLKPDRWCSAFMLAWNPERMRKRHR